MGYVIWEKYMEKRDLTKLQAYHALIRFLEIYYEQIDSDDLGSLLGEMDFLSDGSTADPAAWEEWTDSINIVKPKEETLTRIEAFNAMRKFLETYYKQTSSSDVGSILNDSKILPNGNTVNPVIWNNWTKSVDIVLKETNNTHYAFILKRNE